MSSQPPAIPSRFAVPLRWLVVPLALVLPCGALAAETGEIQPATDSPGAELTTFITQYCVVCHDEAQQTAGLALDLLRGAALHDHAETWEKVVRRLQTRQMPPADAARPTEQEYAAALASLTGQLDAWVQRHPRPGRTESLRRLTRTEYQNAIRDLLALEIDAVELLPPDDASHGFDNVTVSNLSPTLLNRYISAAQQISRMALGRPQRSPGGKTYRIPPDVTQEEHVEGLPLGTRGGILLRHTFPQDGQYDVQVRLARDRNEEVEGLREPHDLIVLLDRAEVQQFTIHPARNGNHSQVDAGLTTRVAITAGPHDVGVTFLKQSSSLLETQRQPYHAHFNMHRHPRLSPAVYQVSIVGPYGATGPGRSPSRERILVAEPSSAEDADRCARVVLSMLMQRAYRRPIGGDDLEKPMRFFANGQRDGGFDAGIEAALTSILVSPEFLFRIERDPENLPPGTAYSITDLELASRLSFFLWSSIPDDELLEHAIRGELQDPAVFDDQVRRMLADPRSRSLITNFAAQWLHLPNLELAIPDLRLFPDFDDNLRQAFRRETELFVESVFRNDQSVLELFLADYTFLNERLAKHYEIPHIHGSHFRRVDLTPEDRRGGLLRHGSVLTVTSYATRTSPVVRGNWVLTNVVGTPPPPAPPNIPALEEVTIAASLPMRDRLAAHRADAACARCHDRMDPIGFAMENYDAVGRWRVSDAGQPLDTSGSLADGVMFHGVDGLEQAIAERPEVVVTTFTEKLLTFALGRGVEYFDAPAIRKIVRDAADDNYKISSIILGITQSVPFRMRSSE